jgi:Tol biopolymer transport system component
MSGVNGFIAFSASTTSGTQLFTVRPDGKDLYQITHVAGDAVNVDWSPDSRRLVFAIGNEKSAKLSLLVVATAGRARTSCRTAR